jgi:hypothetical protein
MTRYYNADKAAIEAGEKQFREALSNQILLVRNLEFL